LPANGNFQSPKVSSSTPLQLLFISEDAQHTNRKPSATIGSEVAQAAQALL
jgi:hypothetical protein